MDSLYLMQLAIGSLGKAYPGCRSSVLRSLYVLLPGEETGYVPVCYLLADSIGPILMPLTNHLLQIFPCGDISLHDVMSTFCADDDVKEGSAKHSEV